MPPSVTSVGVGHGTVYVTCSYDSLGGLPTRGSAALDVRTAQASAEWTAQPNMIGHVITAGPRGIFFGGDFTSLGPYVKRRCLAAFDARTGEAGNRN